METRREGLGFLKKLYYEMLRIRRVEERLVELFNAGHIKQPVHLSIGQEAVAVGVMAALAPQDKIVSNHRCHGHYLAKGGDLSKMFAEILGKATGCSSGRGGTMHLFDDEAGLTISVPIVSASIAFAVGIALSSKIKGEDKISVAFFGDGACEEGIFWESLNFASVNRLPVLFVCENNLYATHSRLSKRQPSEDIFSRVAPFGIPACKIDGNDVLEVFCASESMISSVRTQQLPSFIEVSTYRIKEHWGAGEDWHLGYRSKSEGDYWIERCPIKNLKEVLTKRGVSLLAFEEIEDAIEDEVEKALEFALKSPEPLLENLIGGE